MGEVGFAAESRAVGCGMMLTPSSPSVRVLELPPLPPPRGTLPPPLPALVCPWVGGGESLPAVPEVISTSLLTSLPALFPPMVVEDATELSLPVEALVGELIGALAGGLTDIISGNIAGALWLASRSASRAPSRTILLVDSLPLSQPASLERESSSGSVPSLGTMSLRRNSWHSCRRCIRSNSWYSIVKHDPLLLSRTSSSQRLASCASLARILARYRSTQPSISSRVSPIFNGLHLWNKSATNRQGHCDSDSLAV